MSKLSKLLQPAINALHELTDDPIDWRRPNAREWTRLHGTWTSFQSSREFDGPGPFNINLSGQISFSRAGEPRAGDIREGDLLRIGDLVVRATEPQRGHDEIVVNCVDPNTGG